MLLIHSRAQPRQLGKGFAIAAAAFAQIFGKLANRCDIVRKIEFFFCSADLLPYPGEVQEVQDTLRG